MERVVIGLTEKVIIFGAEGKKKQLAAKIDTGASKNSIDASLAAELNLGPVVETKVIRSAHGSKLRPLVKAKISIAGKEFLSKFTIADRRHMEYRVLIGQNLLKRGFLIDPTKSGSRNGVS
jgi:hypothetical protein